MFPEPEIIALSNVFEALKGLNKSQIQRIIDWITSRFITEAGVGEPGAEAPVKAHYVSVFTEPGQVGETKVIKKRGRKPQKTLPPETPTEVLGPHVHIVIKKDKGDFMLYETLEEIFAGVRLKSVASKVLLASAFLQERKNMKELTSLDVTSRLKEIGQKVKNASPAINGMMKRKPVLLLQVGSMGPTKKSRKKFCVTEAGLFKAREYLKD